MRQSWTDDRLDDFRGEVNRRFDEIDRRFDRVEGELARVNDRLDGMHRVMIQAAVAMSGSTLAGFIALGGLILTQS